MHIENVHIHFDQTAGEAAFSALLGVTGVEQIHATAEFAAPPTKPVLPAIGQPWPGIDGIYAGVSRGENGECDAHLVLLHVKPNGNLTWDDAVEWAQGLGDGARLPTRIESALLYAHLQDQVDTTAWHWTGTQYSASYAWGQGFDHGGQSSYVKKFEARARAVRRLIL